MEDGGTAPADRLVDHPAYCHSSETVNPMSYSGSAAQRELRPPGTQFILKSLVKV